MAKIVRFLELKLAYSKIVSRAQKNLLSACRESVTKHANLLTDIPGVDLVRRDLATELAAPPNLGRIQRHYCQPPWQHHPRGHGAHL